MLNFGKLQDETDLADFRKLAAILKRGDHICKPTFVTRVQNKDLKDTDMFSLAAVTGRPALTDSQELSLDARHLPKLLAPSIAPLPFQIPEEARMQQRHLDLLVNKSARDILVARSFIINHLRAHLAKVLQCVEVQTPILAANAGGASARPFATRATEFSHKEMALRIAPELWLKRLVVAGFDRVFELGPAFRNEGVDHTHNPEFTVCEFYLAHANLDALMNITQNMFYGLAKSVQSLIHKGVVRLDSPDQSVFESRFERVEFIPELQEALGHPLPDLDSPTAVADLIKLLDDAGKDWHLSLPPGNPSLPKLLDHIAGAVLEPRSMGRPLYITHHPVCMSPLAKSFTCPQTGQQVAARAELFFDGNELANMYEEENDPFKQRRKLVGQARARLSGEKGTPAADNDEEPPHVVDEQYISVLESGLPPTGGWGCGVDRLVMLFTGAKRISDVLPFGNLRNVVGLASAGPQSQPQPQESVAVDRARALVRESRKGPWNERTAAAKLDGAAPAARKVPAKSAFEAFSAASFLDMGREAAPPATHSGVSASQGGVVRRSAPKIIEEDETIARGPGSGDPELTSLVAEMAGVEAEMEKTASGAKEAWEKTTAAEDAASALKKDGN